MPDQNAPAPPGFGEPEMDPALAARYQTELAALGRDAAPRAAPPLRHLGQQSQQPITDLDRIPWPHTGTVVTLVATEFTSLCPVTRQPDFGVLTIRYLPVAWLVETKALKLYLWSFRDRPVFTEAVVQEIAATLYTQLEPDWVHVTGDFNLRGGISVQPAAFCPPELATWKERL